MVPNNGSEKPVMRGVWCPKTLSASGDLPEVVPDNPTEAFLASDGPGAAEHHSRAAEPARRVAGGRQDVSGAAGG